jgi:uncharacterized damage-inducible protein DinB
MEKNDLILLFEYNRWANAKVMAASKKLMPGQLFAPAPVSFGSVMGSLAHILSAERIWRMRMQEGISLSHQITAADFTGLDDLATQWQAEESKMKDFVESLRNEDMGRWVEYTRTNGETEGSTLWRVLVHVVNHGTQFRGEAGAALSGFGNSPGDLDLLLYMRESGQR